jgi:hypothetical protein
MQGARIDRVHGQGGVETWEIWSPGREKPIGVALTRADAIRIAREHDRKNRVIRTQPLTFRLVIDPSAIGA